VSCKPLIDLLDKADPTADRRLDQLIDNLAIDDQRFANHDARVSGVFPHMALKLTVHQSTLMNKQIADTG